MSAVLRPATSADAGLVVETLLAAMNWDPARPPASMAQVQATPELWHYVDGWMRPGDFGLVAEVDGRPVGAVWARQFSNDDRGYGYVSDLVPELSMGVAAGHRGQGIGALLLDGLIAEARERGLSAISLSVEDGNTGARVLYETRGFMVVGRSGDSDTMLLTLPA